MTFVELAISEYDAAPLTVFHVVGTEKVTCSLGEVHDRDLVVRKHLGPVVDTVPFDNGYGVATERVRLDAQRRRWESRSPIDYWAGTTWVGPWHGHWTGRLDTGRLHRLLEPADLRYDQQPRWKP